MIRMNRQVILGNRWVLCDDCGFGYRFSQMKRGVSEGQKGLIICPDCFDHKHPSETWISPKRNFIIQEVK